ncbi:hypothetical protein Poli38472_008368 [Pythium oligandrum]|uniref:Uncharacterized protein n=1 Tax=Pythium oligandrum TaxID=41045 RepID=A0A8K1CN82_PYTOL|nr:hypothetical protein Poli38472_008368 [Pythium oligandrum]|eukprot:TMW65726.1 hypothetical protein Poli38472_008368 [Pythium oligandrum]
MAAEHEEEAKRMDDAEEHEADKPETRGGSTGVETRPKRLQDELDAAQERLRNVAQNFSMEWKTFLAYAMKIKQDGADFASFPDKNGLEDLLLHSQSGLVMLREMQQRRDHKWKELLPWRDHGTRRTRKRQLNAGLPTLSPQSLSERRHAAVESYDSLQARNVHLARELIAAKSSPPAIRNQFHPVIAHHYVTRKLQQSIAAQERLRQAKAAAASNLDANVLQREDAELLLRYLHAQYQHSVIYDRFLSRLQWLLKSHRYHIRQRMLEICQAEEARSTPLPPAALLEKAKVAVSVSNGVHCPFFPITSYQLDTELNRVLGDLKIVNEENAVATKLNVDRIFEARFESSRLPAPSGAETSENPSAPSVVTFMSSTTIKSRWEMLQISALLDDGTGRQTAKQVGPLDTDLGAPRQDAQSSLDPLLINEWKLLALDDASYAKTRLTVQAATHLERAIISLGGKPLATTATDPLEELEALNSAESTQQIRDAVGAHKNLSSESLYSFYVSRYLSCRRKRQRLLRKLNYLHFIWFDVARQIKASTGSGVLHRWASEQPVDVWNIEQSEEKEWVVICNGKEHVFQESWHDMRTLELQLLRFANIFIRKQQSSQLADAGVVSANNLKVSLAIDRMQVLNDAYDAELQLLLAKTNLIKQILSCGYGFGDPEKLQSPEGGLAGILQHRPLIDLTHSYFSESYAAETLQFELKRELFKEMSDYSTKLGSVEGIVVNDEYQFHRLSINAEYSSFLLEEEAKLRREADELWFIGISVSQHHALQQALLEKMLSTWKSIRTVEAPSVRLESLQCNGMNLLSGNGWRVVFTPAMIVDTCTRLEQANPENALKDLLVDTIGVIQWRHQLGLELYESQLLEKVHRFQFQFVSILKSGDIDCPSQLFCDSQIPETTQLKQRELTPLIGMSPLAPQNPSQVAGSTQSYPKTLLDWLERMLKEQRDSSALEEHDAMVHFQQAYKESLRSLVNYQDLLASEIYEFAASAPFYFMATAVAHRDGGSGNTIRAAMAVNLKAVRTKYLDEIIDRIREAATKSCYPYWISLDTLWEQLRNHLRAPPSEVQQDEADIAMLDDESLFHVPAPPQLTAAKGYLEEICAIPNLMYALNSHLVGFRNEQKFMGDLFGDPNVDRSVFLSRNSLQKQGGGQPRSRHQTGLSEWLTEKLDQLSKDVRAKNDRQDRQSAKPTSPRNKPALRRQMSRRVSVSSVMPVITVGETKNASAPEDNRLLLDIPSVQMLVELFGVPFHQRTDFRSVAGMSIEEIEAFLRALVEIYGLFSESMLALKMECRLSLSLATSRSGQGKQLRKRLSGFLMSSSQEDPHLSGIQMLRNWQTAFHRSCQRFHDRLTETVDGGSTARDIFAVVESDQIRRKHQLMILRREVASKLSTLKIEWWYRLRCMAIGVALQCLAASFEGGADQDEFPYLRGSLGEITLFSSDHDKGTFDDEESSQWMLLRIPEAAQTPDLMEFWKILGDSTNRAQLEALGEWMELVFAFTTDRKSRRSDSSDLETKTSHLEGVLKAYEELVQKYRFFQRQPENDSYGRDGAIVSDSGSVSVDKGAALSAIAFQMKLPGLLKLLKRETKVSVLRRVIEAIGTSAVSKMKNHVLAERSHAKTSALALPTTTRLELQSEILRVHLEITWMDDDIHQMQSHYEAFVAQRRKYQCHQQHQLVLRGQNHVQLNKAVLFRATVLDLGPYYRPNKTMVSKDGDHDGEYVIPAKELMSWLHKRAQESHAYYEELQAAQERLVADGDSRCKRLQDEVEALQLSLEAQQREEILKRESFAIDKSHQLLFYLEKQDQERIVLQNRMEMEQQILRAELSDAFEKKLAEMHTQLLMKQQQFDEYRQVMQHDLKQQLQAAQSHLVHQLIDQSGAMSVEAKTNFLTSLQGQAALEQLQKENVTLRQALLKLQTVFDMQEQTRTCQLEKTKVTEDTHRMRQTQLMNENTHLKHQITQLEADMTKLSQERTLYQIKLSRLEKQTEETAQKRREAKVRALSAPYRRKSDAMDDEVPPVVQLVEPISSKSLNNTKPLPDYEEEQTAFEDLNERVIRRDPKSAPPDPSRSTLHFQKAKAHLQSEIKRLQQQLAREQKAKTVLMDQVAQLKATISDERQQEVSDGADTIQSEGDRGACSLIQPMSPRVRAASASICTPRRPATGMRPSTRPSTSFSSRSVPPPSAPPRAPLSSNLEPSPSPSSMMSPRSATSTKRTSATPQRKFEVQTRKPVNAITGIAGVPNKLSEREPLPYR